ncbi:hypothetical protein BD410DRAFT_295162 [Rickenella mellea]|uniref:Uncharacterized protein n=1 Tax=Rickenella mellea TaxID=50990 RepID=A0A4Y7Q2M2_9AGAM|nr:hypothetical protein BD410DRAFT_295162 [Rickenella mellea]
MWLTASRALFRRNLIADTDTLDGVVGCQNRTNTMNMIERYRDAISMGLGHSITITVDYFNRWTFIQLWVFTATVPRSSDQVHSVRIVQPCRFWVAISPVCWCVSTTTSQTYQMSYCSTPPAFSSFRSWFSYIVPCRMIFWIPRNWYISCFSIVPQPRRGLGILRMSGYYQALFLTVFLLMSTAGNIVLLLLHLLVRYLGRRSLISTGTLQLMPRLCGMVFFTQSSMPSDPNVVRGKPEYIVNRTLCALVGRLVFSLRLREDRDGSRHVLFRFPCPRS